MKCTEKWFKQQLQEKAWVQKVPIESNVGIVDFENVEVVALKDVSGLLVEREKELREKMKHLEDWGKNMCHVQEPQYAKVWGQYDLIKEFLGDV